MGLFVAASALRDASPEAVAAAIVAYAAGFGVEAAPIRRRLFAFLEPMAHDELVDVTIFAPRGRWTLVLWPLYFHAHDGPMARHLSHALDTLVSTAHIHDGEYWVHGLFLGGGLLDRFVSRPDRLAGGPAAAAERPESWRGNPEVLAEHFGVATDLIVPYLVHPDEGAAAPGKAHPDDRFELANPWVFTDFWRRLGILYPEGLGGFAQRLRLNISFRLKLPTTGQERT